jgi:hypothetical protein
MKMILTAKGLVPETPLHENITSKQLKKLIKRVVEILKEARK